MKNKVLRFIGLMAITGFMIGSFFLSGTVQPSNEVALTLESIEATAFQTQNCEGSGLCWFDCVLYPYAPY